MYVGCVFIECVTLYVLYFVFSCVTVPTQTRAINSKSDSAKSCDRCPPCSRSSSAGRMTIHCTPLARVCGCSNDRCGDHAGTNLQHRYRTRFGWNSTWAANRPHSVEIDYISDYLTGWLTRSITNSEDYLFCIHKKMNWNAMTEQFWKPRKTNKNLNYGHAEVNTPLFTIQEDLIQLKTIYLYLNCCLHVQKNINQCISF